MLTRDERRALLFLAGTAALGGVVRVVRAGTDAPPGASIVAPDLSAGDVAAQTAKARQALDATRPLQPGERIDVDHADADQLARLPRVGPELARRIVAEREAHGAFNSLQGLRWVIGMGNATLRALERAASFSGAPAHMDAGSSVATFRTMALQTETMVIRSPDSARSRGRGRRPALVFGCPADQVSINTATEVELACLPGIGPALATRIVTWRTAHGPFAEVKDLERVPGIGPAKLQRILPAVRAP